MRKPRKWVIPLTYEPKILKVLSGDCTHTIRVGTKYQVGDLVMFHGWEGLPYRSKWSFRTPYWQLCEVKPLRIFPTGIMAEIDIEIVPWDHPILDLIARIDGIEPPTGEELGRVLASKNKIPVDGVDAQAIRWKYARAVA
jgi:hypothetical protein